MDVNTTNRRNFLKIAGIVSGWAVVSSILPGCGKEALPNIYPIEHQPNSDLVTPEQLNVWITTLENMNHPFAAEQATNIVKSQTEPVAWGKERFGQLNAQKEPLPFRVARPDDKSIDYPPPYGYFGFLDMHRVIDGSTPVTIVYPKTHGGEEFRFMPIKDAKFNQVRIGLLTENLVPEIQALVILKEMAGTDNAKYFPTLKELFLSLYTPPLGIDNPTYFINLLHHQSFKTIWDALPLHFMLPAAAQLITEKPEFKEEMNSLNIARNGPMLDELDRLQEAEMLVRRNGVLEWTSSLENPEHINYFTSTYMGFDLNWLLENVRSDINAISRLTLPAARQISRRSLLGLS